MGKEKWGYDYTYDCTGNVNVMRCALEVGYPSSLHHHHHHFLILEMIMFNPGCSPRLGRVLCDWSGGRREGNLNKAVPAGHWKELEGHSLWRLEVEDGGAQAGADRDEGRDGLGTFHHPHIQGLGPGGLTGHLVDFHFILQVNASIDALHSGECLRAIVNIGESDIVQVTHKLSQLFLFLILPLQTKLPKLKSNVKMEGGFMKQLSHWSEANQCEMTFSVFLPTPKSRTAPPPPVSYFGKKTN